MIESIVLVSHLIIGSKIGKFSKVLVSDCDTTKSACILRRNTTANIALDFELGEDQHYSYCDSKYFNNSKLNFWFVHFQLTLMNVPRWKRSFMAL